jgi:putative phosphoesterase
MNIVVVSDTHMPKKGKGLPRRLRQALERANTIIHAGDWQTLEVYEHLSQYGDVYGVFGNVDDDEIRRNFPKKTIIDINGYKIGVVHGDGKGKTTEKRALHAFEGEKVDVIIFGHSHIPIYKAIENKILFNPGSPTDKRRQRQYSFGVITIDEEMTIDLVYFYE